VLELPVGLGFNPYQFMSTDAQFLVKIGFKFPAQNLKHFDI